MIHNDMKVELLEGKVGTHVVSEYYKCQDVCGVLSHSHVSSSIYIYFLLKYMWYIHS